MIAKISLDDDLHSGLQIFLSTTREDLDGRLCKEHVKWDNKVADLECDEAALLACSLDSIPPSYIGVSDAKALAEHLRRVSAATRVTGRNVSIVSADFADLLEGLVREAEKPERNPHER